MFDSTISTAFHDLNIKQLLNKVNLIKRCGIPTTIDFGVSDCLFLLPGFGAGIVY